jgi:polysaccharide export outer membrane protein
MKKQKNILHAAFSYGMLCLALSALVLAGGCVGSPRALPTKTEKQIESGTFSFDQAVYPSKDRLFPKYTISPGDLLDILFQISTAQSMDHFRIGIDHQVTVKFVNNPEINETQNVQPDGRITLPYVGQVYVVGKTIDELTAELKKLYKKTFKDPELYVLIPEFSTAIKELKQDLHTAPRGLSRLVTVRPDGYATFPLIGDVFVATKSIPEANKEIDSLYAQKMPGLHVDLFLEKTHGAVLFVMGEVQRSGAYPIERPISVFEAIALAGGHGKDARLDNIIVMRRNESKVYARRVDMTQLLSASIDAEYFFLKPDDLVYVPKTVIASTAQLMNHLGEIFLFRGWSFSGELFYEGLIDNRK